MSFNITLNSSNVVAGTNNNTYQFNFKSGGFEVPDGAECCINQVVIPYSWVNISSALGNNVLGYSIPAGSSVQYFSTTLADGFYDITGLNTALQTLFRTNGHYWVSSTTTYNPTYIYPLVLSYNSTLYTTTVSANTIPASITTFFGAGYTSGSWSGGGYPTTLLSTYNYASLFIPQTVSSPASLGYLLGFTGATSTPSLPTGMSSNGTFYPTLGLTSANYVSSNGNSLSASTPFPPLGSSVNSLLVRCSLIHNDAIANSDVLDSIGIVGATYGSNINYHPVSGNWVKMRKGKYNSLMVYFQDQSFKPLLMLDSNVMITLLIKFPK